MVDLCGGFFSPVDPIVFFVCIFLFDKRVGDLVVNRPLWRTGVFLVVPNLSAVNKAGQSASVWIQRIHARVRDPLYVAMETV